MPQLRRMAQRQRLRFEMPEAMANAPVLWPALKIYWDAFWDLDSCRVDGGRLSWVVVWDYATRREFDEETREWLLYVVAAMDKVYVDFYRRKRRRGQEDDGEPRRTGPRDGRERQGRRAQREPDEDRGGDAD